MIIDAHVHFGNSFWGRFSPEFLIEIIGENIGICSNLAGIDAYTGQDEIEANLEMLKVSRKYPQIKPLAVCQPDRTETANKIRKLLEEYNEFIGLKFHPEFTKLEADSNKYDEYLQLASEYKLPCLYHSGHIKSKFSSPILIYEKAKKFPNVPVILGHLSTGPKSSHKKAIEIILESIEKNTATLYADISWVEIEDVIMLIEALQKTSKGDYTHRIMWASDAPVGEHNQRRELYAENLKRFHAEITAYFNDKNLLNNLLYNNAKNLFKLQPDFS